MHVTKSLQALDVTDIDTATIKVPRQKTIHDVR